jgi:hypothetical protein
MLMFEFLDRWRRLERTIQVIAEPTNANTSEADRRMGIGATVNRLVKEGKVPAKDADRIRDLLRLRNRLVHSTRKDDVPSDAELADALFEVDRLNILLSRLA